MHLEKTGLKQSNNSKSWEGGKTLRPDFVVDKKNEQKEVQLESFKQKKINDHAKNEKRKFKNNEKEQEFVLLFEQIKNNINQAVENYSLQEWQIERLIEFYKSSKEKASKELNELIFLNGKERDFILRLFEKEFIDLFGENYKKKENKKNEEILEQE